MKHIIKHIYVLFLIYLTCLSCDSFVEVDLPSGQLTTRTVFEDRTTATAAMADVYAKLRDSGLITGNGSGVSNLMGNYADEFIYYGSSAASTQAFYNNALTATNSTVATLWNNSYNEIYSANSIIEGLAASSALQQLDKNQLTGEALFVRALIHFYLTNLYGEIPYITSTNYEVNSHTVKITENEAYQNIIADLKEAQNLLQEDYIAFERTRPNKATASALLARVYLYNENWADASDAASVVINNNNYEMDLNLDNVFLKNGITTIWQFKPTAEGVNTAEGGNFIFLSGPPPFVALREELLESFESGDNRLSHWTKALTNGTTTWYHVNKYKQKTNTGTSLEYSIVLRLAEQYLIRAEARARQGELVGAKEDLNVIRNTAGLNDTPAINQEEILDAIQRERRSELFTEYGHRFFDLKRTGIINAVLTPLKPGWNTTDILLPLPESELLLNPNLLPQNPGY